MFKLEWPTFPSPFWFSSKNRGESVEGEVVSENLVKTCFDTLVIVKGEIPATGTKVIIKPGSYFLTGKTLEEIEKENIEENKRKEELKKEKEEERKKIEKKIRKDAEKTNNSLNIPVQWTSGFKSVLSGLSEKGWGNGVNKKSVVHILLKEDIKEGNFKRNAGSFLCTTKGGNDGLRYVDLERLSCDEQGSYISEITCKTCLKIAKRWLSIQKELD